MKRTFKIIGIVILVLVLYRGSIYRLLINYTEIGTRIEVKITNQKLVNKININLGTKKINLEEIINIANRITCEELKFNGNKVSNNPNELINTKQANCIGYSATFNTIANYLIKQYKLENILKAEHKIGQLDFLGINLHQFFENPFFKDHDFNIIKNLETGKEVSIDPSISDYLGIDYVNIR